MESVPYSFGKDPNRLDQLYIGFLPMIVDLTYKKLVESGANIVDDIKNKPWRLRHLAGVLRINLTLFVAAALH